MLGEKEEEEEEGEEAQGEVNAEADLKGDRGSIVLAWRGGACGSCSSNGEDMELACSLPFAEDASWPVWSAV